MYEKDLIGKLEDAEIDLSCKSDLFDAGLHWLQDLTCCRRRLLGLAQSMFVGHHGVILGLAPSGVDCPHHH